jgi:hypothetical protein
MLSEGIWIHGANRSVNISVLQKLLAEINPNEDVSVLVDHEPIGFWVWNPKLKIHEKQPLRYFMEQLGKDDGRDYARLCQRIHLEIRSLS